jgi:glycosyltransferase involved in cell wall biosynthesis
LEAAIGALLDDPGRRRDLGEAARRRALERFSWARVAESYETILRGAIARRC